MTSTIRLVETFYHEVWNRADEALARRILHPGFRFRGTLGVETRGAEGFLDYMRLVRAVLADYSCTIEDIVGNGDRVAARMLFAGRHVGPFLDAAPTGRHVSWSGAAFFTADGETLTDLWALGDLDSLKRQLAP